MLVVLEGRQNPTDYIDFLEIQKNNGPSLSSELNLVENRWRWLARKIYAEEKLFEENRRLIGAIEGIATVI